jgi:hypothetical protein
MGGRAAASYLSGVLAPYPCTHCGRPAEYCVCQKAVTR